MNHLKNSTIKKKISKGLKKKNIKKKTEELYTNLQNHIGEVSSESVEGKVREKSLTFDLKQRSDGESVEKRR